MKSYIIHSSKLNERKKYVDAIQKVVPSQIFEAIMIPGNGGLGCKSSHEAVYNMADSDGVLVFEDDCEIIDDSFMNFVNNNRANYDIIYIGTLPSVLPFGSWGTHAMWLSPKAIGAYFLFRSQCKEIDNIWNDVEKHCRLKVLRPSKPELYVRQAVGLKSQISGNIRGAKLKLPKKLDFKNFFKFLR